MPGHGRLGLATHGLFAHNELDRSDPRRVTLKSKAAFSRKSTPQSPRSDERKQPTGAVLHPGEEECLDFIDHRIGTQGKLEIAGE
jgi:hypothetical protein